MSQQGTIFDIQRFSIHDGPGIRTSVFMKGCPLRCRWCANPESQRTVPQLMVRPVKCTGCGLCVAACPQAAIRLPHDRSAETDWDRCRHCFTCVEACLYGAREAAGRVVSVAEVTEAVLSDRVFYTNSGGGLTVSGGEPLGQPGFVEALLMSCREEGVHTALETCGYGPPEAVERLCRHLDLVLFDIKQLNPLKHRRFTGKDNHLILENALRFARRVETWFRIPLVAGVNDSAEHLDAVSVLAEKLRVNRISLLPYHAGGVAKAQQIGREAAMPEAGRPDDGHLQHLVEIVSDHGLTVAIGH